MNQNQDSDRPNSNQADEKSQLNGSALNSIFEPAEPSSFSNHNSPHDKVELAKKQPADLSNLMKEEAQMESESSAPDSPTNVENRDSADSPVNDPLLAYLEQAANIFHANFNVSLFKTLLLTLFNPIVSESQQGVFASAAGLYAETYSAT